jgi:signal transduction histidine kinase
VDKPSYKELEIQVAKLKKQIDYTLNNPGLHTFELKTLSNELKDSNIRLTIEEGKKVKLEEELDIISNKLKYLLKLNAEKDQFITILAHDLKSPFSGILGLLQLLSENITKNTTEKNLDLINNIQQSAKNTLILLEGLINWTKSQIGNLPFEPKVYDIKEVFTDIIELFQPLAELKNISVNKHINEKTIVFADINMLKTILRNLISNAIKFTDENGRIDISAEKTKSFVTISVSDNGSGMSSSILKHLFSISHVRSTNSPSNVKGSGLGLLICKELTEINGGKISAESELGRGSKFIITFPRKIQKAD